MNEPLFVRLEKGTTTAGDAIFEVRCICDTCKNLTVPTHTWNGEEDYDSDIALAELGMIAYGEVLREANDE